MSPLCYETPDSTGPSASLIPSVVNFNKLNWRFGNRVWTSALNSFELFAEPRCLLPNSC